MGGITRNPSPYNPRSFHLLRLAQLTSAIIVSSVVCFFVHYLLLEHYKLPWTFVFLLAASLFTIVSLLVSGALYFFRTLPPRYNLFNNAFLSVLWTLGLSFLTWNTGWTLGHRCLVINWKTEAGIMVCRLYKACAAFTITGLLSTLLNLFLDVKTYRKTTQRGKYNQMHMPDQKRSIPLISSPMPQYEPFGSQRTDDTGDLSEQKPYRVQESIERTDGADEVRSNAWYSLDNRFHASE
ncbi:MAG: hypothetical protein L6R39_001106 [Caloplaca ligustica]|nr:MAG: hypothetical protein L6R39_001106 [Caloplaca ligustica]